MKIVVAGALLLALAGCSASEPEPEPEPLTASEQAELDAALAPDMPAGFTDGGTGLGYQFVHDGVDCSYYDHCVNVELYAYSDCPTSVYVEANVMTEDSTVIGYTNDTLSSLSTGQKGRMILGSMEDGAARFQLTKISCY